MQKYHVATIPEIEKILICDMERDVVSVMRLVPDLNPNLNSDLDLGTKDKSPHKFNGYTNPGRINVLWMFSTGDETEMTFSKLFGSKSGSGISRSGNYDLWIDVPSFYKYVVIETPEWFSRFMAPALILTPDNEKQPRFIGKKTYQKTVRVDFTGFDKKMAPELDYILDTIQFRISLYPECISHAIPN